MAARICRSPDHCQHPVGENGYFCTNHFKLLDIENRHLILAYPPKPGRSPEGLNQALHKALFDLRRKLNVQEPVDVEAPEEAPREIVLGGESDR